ncbi:MAG: hypothetical protein DMG30_12015 [Acidobacteria bacterium]|nr:MAG: hypothetical protein DMG30_12015 [Acidobacteriota bacterium]
MSQEWPKVSKNERHGYEEPERAAAPTPAPLSPYDWRVFKGIPDERSYSGTKIDELLTEYTAHLQAELQAAHKTVYDIQTVAYEANRLLEKRAEQAEARCRELEAELERVRKQGTDAVLDLKEQMQEMKIIHNDDLKAAEARCRVLEEALRKYWHCRHAWMIDCFCTKEARAALAPG